MTVDRHTDGLFYCQNLKEHNNQSTEKKARWSICTGRDTPMTANSESRKDVRKDIFKAYISKCKCKFMKAFERIFNNDKNQVMYLEGEQRKPFGNYFVSNFGRIYSLYKNRLLNPLLKKNESKYYYVVRLYNDNEQKLYKVHRLVAMLFIPDLEQKAEVHHIRTKHLETVDYCLIESYIE